MYDIRNCAKNRRRQLLDGAVEGRKGVEVVLNCQYSMNRCGQEEKTGLQRCHWRLISPRILPMQKYGDRGESVEFVPGTPRGSRLYRVSRHRRSFFNVRPHFSALPSCRDIHPQSVESVDVYHAH